MLKALRALFGKSESPVPARPAKPVTARLVTTVSGPGQRPRKPAQGPSSRSRDIFHRSEFMPREREAECFILGPNGLPTGYLVRQKDRLVIVPDQGRSGEVVNPASTRLHSLGIYSFRVRGVGYHEAAAKAGDFRPGKPVRLVREPENEYDPNAIAVYADKARSPVGYVNRQNATRLAKRMDAGEEIAAISTRGAGPGGEGNAPVILAASPKALAHLMRRL